MNGQEEQNSFEALSEMLQNLSIANEEDRKQLLIQAKIHLLAPDASSRFKNPLERGDFSVIFDCLTCQDKTVVKSACEILSRVFEFVDAEVIVGKYGDLLQKGLSHPLPEVKEVILKVMNKSLAHDKQTLLSHQRYKINLKSIKTLF